MTSDEILMAFREAAMGRVNTIHQVTLAEKLAALLATPEQRAEADMVAAGIEQPAKRGPGRPKKAA